MATALKQVSVQDFVSSLRKFPESAFDETEIVRQFLQDNPVNPDSLAPYLTWDRQHYTRNLIDKTPLYELIAVCWDVGQASSGTQPPRPELLDGRSRLAACRWKILACNMKTPQPAHARSKPLKPWR